jgi:hypothetical protein
MEIEDDAQFPHFQFRKNRPFDLDLHSILSEPYLNRINKELKTDHQTQIWLKSLSVQVKTTELAQKMTREKKQKTKLIYSKLK